MHFSRLLFSLTIPLVIWLLFGAPSLALPGNAALLAVVVAHLYTVIWIDVLFTWLRGDVFTYGMVTRSINMLSFLTTLAIAWVAMLTLDRHAESLASVSMPAWGVMILGLLLTIALPLQTGRVVKSLPTAADRRSFHDPREDQQP